MSYLAWDADVLADARYDARLEASAEPDVEPACGGRCGPEGCWSDHCLVNRDSGEEQ